MADELKVPEGFKKVEDPVWEFEIQSVFEGVFLSVEKNVGPNQSNMYSFKVKDGSIVNVWGTTVLDTRFKNLQFGEEVIVHYLGLTPSKKEGGSDYHNFDVYHKMPELKSK